MLRRVASCNVCALGVRRNAVYSESNPLLTQEQKARGFDNNLWIEEFDEKRFSFVRKGGVRGTPLSVAKSSDMYNADQVEGLPTVAIKAPVHTSFATNKPYGQNLSRDMDVISEKNQYVSKYWVPKGLTQTFKVKSDQRPHRFFSHGMTNVVNVCELENTAATDFIPISGTSRSFYSLENGAEIRKYNESMNFRSGLTFTESSLSRYGLKLKSGAIGFGARSHQSDSRFAFYNVSDLVDAEQILLSLGRTAPADFPRFLLSGWEIKAPSILTHAAQYSNPYFISGDECKLQGFRIKDGVTPFFPSDKAVQKMFNVQELEDPGSGFRMAGSKVTALIL